MQSPYSIEFDFNSGRTSPCGSSPSTPKGFGNYYFSVPTTPARAKYIEPKTINSPLLQHSPISTKSDHNKKSLWSSFSPKRHKDQSNREARTKKKGSKTSRRATRSLSPTRKLKYPYWEDEELINSEAKNTKQLSSKGTKKWRFKDLFLFRSSSEGRAWDKDPLNKYSYFHRKQHEFAKTTGSSQLLTQGSNSIIPVRNGPISAHELHYTINKAVSQDMKKKSFLPYKQGILGRLAFNPAVHALANGFGSLA